MGWKDFLKGTAKVIIRSDIPDNILKSKGVPGFIIDGVEKQVLERLEKPSTPKVQQLQEVEIKDSKMALEVRELKEIFAFPYYATREEFEKQTGEVCPPFNPAKPPKRWRDLTALSRPGKLVEYFNTLKISENGTLLFANGVPEFDSIVLLKADAATVNIPETVPANIVNSTVKSATKEEAVPEVQVPLDFTKIPSGFSIKVRFGGTVALVSGTDTPENNGGFTSEDRRVLGETLGKINAILERLKNI